MNTQSTTIETDKMFDSLQIKTMFESTGRFPFGVMVSTVNLSAGVSTYREVRFPFETMVFPLLENGNCSFNEVFCRRTDDLLEGMTNHSGVCRMIRDEEEL